MRDNTNFCIQPFIHIASWNDGSVPLCCVAHPEKDLNLNTHTLEEVWNSEQLKQARLDFLNNKRPPQCNSCWREEDNGVSSHRQIENSIWERKLGSDYLDKIVESTHDDGTLDTTPLTLDLRLGNTCNLQCVMCRPRDSSKWVADSKRLSEILVNREVLNDWRYKANSIANSDVFDWFERLETQNSLDNFIGDIRHIIFGGGEPLLLKEHERFITRLVASGASEHIELRYHTNGTILNERFIELWSKFKQVELYISLDDWGDRNNYVRYPADFDVILKNLRRLDNTPDNITVGILTTIHAMNVYNIPDFATNLLSQNFKKVGSRGLYIIGTTHWPRYMSTTVLPTSVKDKVVAHWNSFSALIESPFWQKKILPQLEFMLSRNDDTLFADLLDYIEKLDTLRPVKFGNVYQEYNRLLQDYNRVARWQD